MSTYEFKIVCTYEKSEKALLKYLKNETDPDDKYNGMTMRDLKDSDLYGEKIYQYPPCDVTVKLSAFVSDEDGSVVITGFVLDGDKEISVGTAAKGKSNKILRTLQDNGPAITGELSGGNYWKLEDSGYVNKDWSDPVTLRVCLEW